MHPFVSGELARGNLKSRGATLSALNALPSAKLASHAEVFQLIEDRRLWGQGLGWGGPPSHDGRVAETVRPGGLVVASYFPAQNSFFGVNRAPAQGVKNSKLPDGRPAGQSSS
jgi:hypothetical protein